MHTWGFAAACALRRQGWGDQQILAFLESAVANVGRTVSAREIQGWLNGSARAMGQAPSGNRAFGRDPVRVFVGIVRRRLWHHITQTQESVARAMLNNTHLSCPAPVPGREAIPLSVGALLANLLPKPIAGIPSAMYGESLCCLR